MKSNGLSTETAKLTDVGLIRKNNEDRVFVLEKEVTDIFGVESLGIYLIADGMGGHQAGEIASEMAFGMLPSILLDNLTHGASSCSPGLLVRRAIQKVNKQIFLSSQKEEYYSMGTTITLGLRLDNELYLGHVGDSRAYLIRNGSIKQLTEDHSVVAYLLKEKAITPEEVKTHPDRGKIFRCLGTSANVLIDTVTLTLHASDSLVFCSDGLSSCVSDPEILQIVQDGKNPGEACKKMIDIANSRGGEDNTSIIVIKVLPIAKASKGC